MIDEEDLLIMERFLAGDLKAAEIKEFEHRLKTDSEFARHYSIMRELPDAITTDVKGFKYLYVTSFEPETTFSVPFGFVSLIVAVYVTVPALYGT